MNVADQHERPDPDLVGDEQMLTPATASTPTTAPASTCGGHVLFTAAELALLAALPQPAEPLETTAWCELEVGHPGLHYGLGQIADRTWWWLRWSEDLARRELVDGGFCGRRPEHGVGDCTLPSDHPGRHSYELGTTE